MSKWNININKLAQGGFAPLYWKNDNPTFGNKYMMADMTNIDMTSANYITQGPGLSTLTDGDDSGNVSTVIKGLNDISVASDEIYGVGGDQLYKITSSAVTNPNTISGTSPEGEDVCYYAGELFYSYNDDGSGDIGKYDMNTDYDDDWWTDDAGGSALEDASHPMVSAGTSGVLYIGNGQYVAEWDGSTAVHDTFNTFDSDSEVVDLAWNQNRLFIASNRQNLDGDNRNEASIYLWDGNSVGWTDRVEVLGRIGALMVKNGITFVIYKKNISQDVCTLGYVDGTQIKDVFNYEGDLPEYYQTTRYEDFVLWVAGDEIYAWGGGDVNVETRGFQISEPKYSNGGGITNAFGTPIVTSDDGSSSYDVSEFSGSASDASADTITIAYAEKGSQLSKINKLHFRFDKLTSGAQLDYTVRNSEDESLGSGTISYTNDGEVTYKTFGGCKPSSEFYIELDFSSSSAPFKLRSIQIVGNTVNG